MNHASDQLERYCRNGPIIPGLTASLLACLLILPVQATFASSANAVVPELVRASALQAQQRCNDLGHDNMDEYVSCTDALFLAVKGNNAAAFQQRLGILYFGWLGAERWQRVGLPGSEEAAKRYFWQFRPLQKKLGLNDQSLCAVLDGDCTVRLAQVAVALKEYGGAPASVSKVHASSSTSAKSKGRAASAN